MGFTQPISLLRLRSATAAYAAILKDSLPELEALAELHEVPGLPNPVQNLLETVQTTLDLSHGGGVADVLLRVEAVLGKG